MYREISLKVQDIVANIFLEDLNQHFPEGFVAGPVVVEGDEFRDGEPNLRVTIVYEGDLMQLDTEVNYGQLRRVIPKMADEGIEEFPIIYFRTKSMWESQNREQKKIAGE